jgi:uncharacterized repeat protein (TIGR01451 family)
MFQRRKPAGGNRRSGQPLASAGQPAGAAFDGCPPVATGGLTGVFSKFSLALGLHFRFDKGRNPVHRRSSLGSVCFISVTRCCAERAMNNYRKTRAWFAKSRPTQLRRFRPQLCALEDRLAPANLTIDLDPVIDQFGSQYEVVQIYRDADGDRQTFGIFDTGASPVTFSTFDQTLFELGEQAIPLIPGVTVEAEGIGGTLTGVVSQPGTIVADGLHAVDLFGYFSGDPNAIDLSMAAAVDGVQAMIGTEAGSPNLPAIVGTPILNGRISGSAADGVAVLVDQYGYEIDVGALFAALGFGDLFDGLILQMPDVFFVAPGTNLTQGADMTAPVRIPLDFIGIDNHLDPGTSLTESFNPVVDVSLSDGGNQTSNHTFLFDTGAQLSILSSAIAAQLGLDLNNPEFSIDVGGAGGDVGSAINVKGFLIDALTLPLDDDNDGVIDGELNFTGAPVFVLDFSAGLDGILGMNVFNPATHLLYDPINPEGPGKPSLQATFSTLPRETIDLEQYTEEELALLQALPVFGGLLSPVIPSFNPNNAPSVAADQPSVTVNEGQTASNTGTFSDIDGDTVQLGANVGTVTKTGANTWSWSLATTDGNAGPFLVTITADDGRGGMQTANFSYSVANVAPTISLSGPASVQVGVVYNLDLGAVVDPGTDTVSSYQVHWGTSEGSTAVIAGSPAGQTLQHTYADSGVQRTITVDLFDEDGTHVAAGSKTVTITAPGNTAPTVAVDDASVSASEGQNAANTGAFADSDGNTVTISASVGSVTKTGTSSGTWSWSLAIGDGPAGPVLVTITADDGQGGIQTTTFSFTALNVVPNIGLSGPAAVDKQSVYDLEFGAVVDPGADTVTGYQVHWGDGTSSAVIPGAPTGMLQHVYTVGGVQRTITIDLIDEDGTHNGAGSKQVTVREVVPNLWIKQQAKPARVARGGVLTFTITVVNRGAIEATGVVVDYSLPASLSFLRKGSTPGWQKVTARKFQRVLGSLAAGQSVKLVFKARAANTLRLGAKLTTTAIVRDDGLNGPDANLADNRFKISARVL